jgi:hypothetical protein
MKQLINKIKLSLLEDMENQDTRQYMRKNLVLDIIFSTSDEATIAADGLRDINNYGRYVNQLQTWDPGLKKFLDDYFGPSNLSRKSMEKERGEPFPVKTASAVSERIKEYFQEKPSKSIIDFTTTDNILQIPIYKNRISEDNIKSIVKEVLPKIGLRKYKMKTKNTEMNEIQFSREFNTDNIKGDGERKIPRVIAFPFKEIIKKLGKDHIKIASKPEGTTTRGEEKKLYLIYISKDLKTALDQLTRGRTSRATEKTKFDLTKRISEVLPSMVRGVLKKGTDGAKLIKFDGKEMYPVNWEILGINREKDTLWLATRKDEEMDFNLEEINLKEIIKKTIQEKLKLSSIKEDMDVGHEDDEPNMLKANLYRIAEYATFLYKMLDKYDQMNQEIDFPDWWQEKIHLASDYLDKAKHYLEFESKDEMPYENDIEENDLSTMSPADQSAEDQLDSLIRKYMNNYVDNHSDDFTERYGNRAERVMYGASIKRAKKDLEDKGLAEKLDPVGKEDEDINNDNKVDKTDSYLLNKRKKISKNISKK